MIVDICLCTHNPRVETLERAIRALARQSAGPGAFSVLLVDNASTPALTTGLLEPLLAAGIPARLIREEKLGISHARLRAADETDAEWVLFVDDDNELAPDYVEKGVAFARQHPEVGCFGGKLLLAPQLRPARWVVPFLPYLGIKDLGDETLIGRSDKWERWEPPTAGAFVRRPLLDAYRAQAADGDSLARLGRKGRGHLASCEDSLIMRNAYALGLANAYHPALVLYHHLDPRRFAFRYLVRLLYGYGVSHVVLESVLSGGPKPVPPYYGSVNLFARTVYWIFRQERRQSFAYGIGQVAYHFGARDEHMRQARSRAG